MEELIDINPIDEIFDKELEARVMKELAKVEELQEYLRMVMARDLRQHFTVKKEQQDIVRGAFYRTQHFSKLIAKEFDNK